MLNFNFELTVSQKEVVVKDNEVFVDGEEYNYGALSHKAVNTVNDKYLNLVQKADLKFLKNKPVADMIEAAEYLRKAQKTIVVIKDTISDCRSKALEELEGMARIHVDSKIEKLPYKGLPLVDKVKLSDAADKNLGVPDSWNMSKWYDTEKDDDSKIRNQLKIVEDDERHLGEYTEKFIESCKKVLKTIEIFRAIRDAAGDDLVNWSQHKTTRWLNSNFSDSSKWEVESYISSHVKILLKSGIERTPVKIKVDKVANLVRNFQQYCEAEKADLSQADLLRIFKKGISEAIDYFDYAMVTEVIATRHSTRVLTEACNSNMGSLIRQGARTASTSDEFYNMWNTTDDIADKCFIPMEVMDKFKESIELEDVLKFFRDNRCKPLSISEDYFNYYFSKSIGVSKYKIHADLSSMFLERASDTEKLFLLEAIGLKENIFYYKDALDLTTQFKNVDYQEVQHVVMQDHFNHDFLTMMYPIVLRQQDSVVASKILKKGAEFIWSDKGIAHSLFKILDSEQKLEVYHYNNDAKGCREKYCESINKVLTKDEMLLYFNESLINRSDNYQATIFENLKSDPKYLTAMQHSLLTMLHGRVTFFEYGDNREIVSSPEWKNVRLRLLSLGTNFVNPDKEFFKDMTREELQVATDNDILTHTDFARYYPDKLTFEELSDKADNNDKFKRANADLLGYKYFKDYEDMFGNGKDAGKHRKAYFSSGGGGGYTNEDKRFMAKVKEICKLKGSKTLEFMYE